jgi:hypothetical protein
MREAKKLVGSGTVETGGTGIGALSSIAAFPTGIESAELLVFCATASHVITPTGLRLN